ncbi:hypothetical protein CPB84DRAFT_1761719 [Gymnopilus junonius]|uniref:Uncharacterized protein n=1 Tax=Gymnopilus junonius TaxID=109634 RepID=A0A9P5P027_GYMJU|nr:hypothetical protein CPB84DRAFT_1761719 [Gymnopilus junonius]
MRVLILGAFSWFTGHGRLVAGSFEPSRGARVFSAFQPDRLCKRFPLEMSSYVRHWGPETYLCPGSPRSCIFFCNPSSMVQDCG